MRTTSDIKNIFFKKSDSLFTFQRPAPISLNTKTVLILAGAMPDFNY